LEQKQNKTKVKYSSIPATGNASESVFSRAGEIVSQRRSFIKSKNVNVFKQKQFKIKYII
jgi:hypothetical protein